MSVFSRYYWKLFTESLLCALRLTEKQPITGCYQHICRTTTCARVLQTNIPFYSGCQRCKTESWLLTKQATSPCGGTYEDSHPMRDSTHMGTPNSPSSSLWICTDQPPKLQRTERTVTKTNAIVKSAEKTVFLLFFFLYLSLNINPLFQPNFSTSGLSKHECSNCQEKKMRPLSRSVSRELWKSFSLASESPTF